MDTLVRPAMSCEPIPLSAARARRTRQGVVTWGDHRVTVGGDAPVRVQSMTNTDTADAVGTAIQVKELALAGSSWFASRSTTTRLPRRCPTSASNSIAWASRSR